MSDSRTVHLLCPVCGETMDQVNLQCDPKFQAQVLSLLGSDGRDQHGLASAKCPLDSRWGRGPVVKEVRGE